MISHLPCKKCGSCLPIVKGSIVQCPYCGAKNLYMESFYTFKYYAHDILNLSSLKKEKHIKTEEIERRKVLIELYYRKINSSFNEYRHLIITKLDTIDVDPIKLYYLIRASGNFEIIIERFLLNNLEKDKSKKKYMEFRDVSYIINKSLLGLYYTYLAKRTNYSEKCFKFYQYAEKNYQNVVDYCNIAKLENNGSHLYKRSTLYSVLVEFTAVLRNILDKNPIYYSEKLEDLLKELRKAETNDTQTYNLYRQIEHLYQLERDTCILLENIRIDDPFLLTETFSEEGVLTVEENLDKLNRIRNWINNLSEKYQKYQRSLLKLHSGRIIKYLDSYRNEFIDYKNKNAKKFDNLVGNMINDALESYNSETIETLETISDLMQKNIYNENLLERFRIRHDDLIVMDDVLKKFVNTLFEKPLLSNLESEYYKKLISLISVKHTEFDKYVSKYIIRMLKDFEDIRSKKVLSLKEQRNQFISEIKPNLQKLIDLSFTLNEEILPYPLFIDIKTQNEKLKVNNPETMLLTIENPNTTDIKNIKIYFFIPEQFQNKLTFTSIKKLKANEIRKIKAKIIPKEKGKFLSMVMIEYQHFDRTFWMPSIKFNLEVEETKKYSYYPKINKELLYIDYRTNHFFTVIRSCIQ